MEAIEGYNSDLAHIVRAMHQRKLVDYETFQFDITKNFGWKPGTYPFIHKLIDYFEARYMRASGMESIFKRRISNEGYLDNHRRRLMRMDNLRAKAKSMVNSKEADASEYEERMHTTLELIDEMTAQGNNVSDKVKYSHYFTTNNYDVEHPYTFLDLKLITRIDIEPMDMCYVQHGSPVFNIMQPAVVAYYARPLYKVLNGDNRWNGNLMGYSKNRHSYLQNHALWRPDRAMGMNINPWTSICLSSYNDDVIRSMNHHKYSDSAFAITQWGSSYNLETTNPYNSPNHLLYEQGLPDNNVDLRSIVGFNYNDCFNQRSNIYRAIEIEENPLYQKMVNLLDSYNRTRTELFGHNVLNDCKDCPVKENCDHYNYQVWYEEVRDEYGPMVEALIAEESELDNYDHDDFDLYYSWTTYVRRIANEHTYQEAREKMDSFLDDIGFYKEPLTAEEQSLKDAQTAQLQAQKAMERWAMERTHGG